MRRMYLLLVLAGCGDNIDSVEVDAMLPMRPSVQAPGPCNPTRQSLDGDVSAAVFVDARYGACGLSRVPWTESLEGHALLFVRDRPFCTRNQCFGFDSLHVMPGWNIVLPGGEPGYLVVTSASHGSYDDVVGAWHDLPVDTPITFELALEPFVEEALAAKASVTFTYSPDRIVSLLAVAE